MEILTLAIVIVAGCWALYGMDSLCRRVFG